MAVRPIDIEHFSTSARDVYEAIVVASKRARQIHADIKIELGQRIETLNQLTSTTETEDEMDVSANPDQLRISLEFEKRAKPTEVALQELSSKNVRWRYKEIEEPAAKPKEKEEEEETE